jgi:hypothetical protein
MDFSAGGKKLGVLCVSLGVKKLKVGFKQRLLRN